MTYRHVRTFASLLPAAALLLPVQSLFAEDCGCPKPKVKITESSYGDPDLVKMFFTDDNGEREIKPDDDPVQMERDKEYSLRVQGVYSDTIHGCEYARLNFPHCTIEYLSDGFGESGQWTKGIRAQINIGLNGVPTPPVLTYLPLSISIRITGKASEDAQGCSDAPGTPANAQSSEAKYDFNSSTSTPTLSPPGFGLEIPMGAAHTAAGYRSAGFLVSYGPVSGTSAATSSLRYNHISEVNSSVSQYSVVNGSGVTTEKQYIVPQGVFRIRGWNSATQSVANWQGASETSIDVYDPSNYNVSTHSFSGTPHSYYHLEVVTGSSLQPGLKLVQSNNGLVTSRSIQASADGLTLRDSEGPKVTETVAIPPEVGETSWGRQITVTTDSVITSSRQETYDLNTGHYVRTILVEDPSSASGDELTTTTSYYEDGKERSVIKPDGSWSFYTYSGDTTTTYSPWLSDCDLVLSGGVWALPTSGMVVKTISSDTGSSSYLVDLSGTEWDVQLSGNSTSSYTYGGYTRTSSSEGRGDAWLSSYTLAYADTSTDLFLAGKTVMNWDDSGKATLYQYEKGNWASSVFTPDTNGLAVRTSAFTGYIALPSSGSVETDFTNVPSHSTKEVTITTALGVVRAETHVCNASGVYQLAVAKDHEYETSGLQRPTGIKIGGVYISKTEYFSPTVTREWSEDGSMVETEINADGEIVRQTTSGDAIVPAVMRTYDHTGMTTTTAVNSQTVSVVLTDRLGREDSTWDATGTETKFTYADGGRTVTRTRPKTGGVTTIESRYKDGQPISTTGTGVIPRYYSYSIDPTTNQMVTTTTIGSAVSARATSRAIYWDGSPAFETFPDPSGSGTITKTYEYATSSSTPVRFYSSATNTADQIQLDPASSSTAAMGHYSLSGSETDGDGPVIASTDHLTETSTSYVLVGTIWNLQTVTRVFHTNGSSSSYAQTSLQALAPVSTTHSTYGSGLRWVSSTSNGTTTVTSNRDYFFDGIAATVSTDDSATSASPDSTSVSRYGKPTFSSVFGSSAGESTIYDAAGRLIQRVSATDANTFYGYNSAGQLETTTDHEGKTTTYVYYGSSHQNAGMLWKTTNPASETTETIYNTCGQVTETTGNGAYRVTRSYNAYGEMNAMRTYRTSGSTGDLTQWNYSASSGLLQDKTDAAGKKTTYTYDAAGRMKTRTWARTGTIKATYTYNAFGDLTKKDYSDTAATDDVVVTPDRLGRPASIKDDSGTRTFTYQPVTGATDLVAYNSGGLLSSLQIDYTQDASLRPSGYSVSGSGPSSVLAYDSAGRLSTVTASGSVHTHSYAPGTDLLAGMTTTSGATTVLSRTLYRDRMQRLRGIVTANASGTALSRHGYTLDAAGRRATATRENAQRWDYGYDTLGQVTSAVKKFPDGAAIPGHTFGYTFDGIGNRTAATQGGEDTAVTYTPNALNQYTGMATEKGRYILGEAPTANAVTVNGLTAARAGGLGFYWEKLNAANGSGPVWSNDSVVSNGVTIAGRTWTPAASVSPSYDEDGNLKSDGRWDYTWDAENRLIQMKATAAALTAATASGIPVQKLDFVYDSQGRRVSKTVSTSTTGTTWTFLSNQRFLYDDWNLIAEYSAPSATSTTLTLQAAHVWGADLSNTFQGAGGVGGLLATHLVAAPTAACYPAYDGNGNISAWVDGAGTLLARMDYSPFGQLIGRYNFTTAGSTTLSRLGFGYSTKYVDIETGYLYYSLRFYDAINGRWLSRDPSGERGGVNLYGFLNNSCLDQYDYLGLWSLLRKSATGNKRWAPACAEFGDTWERLSKKTRLDAGDAQKWVQNWDSEPKVGKKYLVPNVIVHYETANVGYSTRENVFPDWANGGIQFGRRWAANMVSNYKDLGWKVVAHVGANSRSLFISSWQEEGIGAIAFAGHGVEDSGFCAADLDLNSDNAPVESSEVKPKYKLALVQAMCCWGWEMDWRQHRSSDGLAVEFKGLMHLSLGNVVMTTN